MVPLRKTESRLSWMEPRFPRTKLRPDAGKARCKRKNRKRAAISTTMAFASRFGRVSHALVKEQLREKFAHVSRRIEMTGDAMRTATDRKGKPVEIRHNCEHGFIGDVVTDEQRPASPERLMRHQFAHTDRK